MEVINIFTPGHLDIADSYGLIALELARGLSRLGVYVNLLPMGRRKMPGQDEELAAIVAQPVRAATGGICLGYPTTFAHYGLLAAHGPRLAMTMFESSRIPPDWVPILNRCEAVIVPSRFCSEVFASSGITTPIYVAPLGIGDNYRPAQRDPDPPFTFLAFLDRGSRKGGLAAVQAFLTAFGDDPNYRLLLKSRTPKVPMQLLNDNIDIIQEDLTQAEFVRLYLGADCLLNANRGEGFGLLPREFAATGGIALATGWGGTAEEIDDWGIPLPYTLVPAAWEGVQRFAGLDLGVWAEPDIEGIAAILRQVVDRWDEYRQRALQAAAWVHAHYRWSDFAKCVLDIWLRTERSDAW